MAVSEGTLSGLSEYQTADDEITAFNKANPKEQIPEALASRIKLLRGGSKFAFESGSIFVGGKILGLGKLSKIAKDAILKTAFTPTVLQTLGKMGGVTAARVLSEVVISATQAYANRLAVPTAEQQHQTWAAVEQMRQERLAKAKTPKEREKIQQEDTWTAMLPNFAANTLGPWQAAVGAIGPATVASLLLGGVGSWITRRQSRSRLKTLANEKMPVARRQKVVAAIAKSIDDPVTRDQWLHIATAVVAAGQPIRLDQSVEEFVTSTMQGQP